MGLVFDEGQQVAVEAISMGEEHTVPTTGIDFEFAARNAPGVSASTEVQRGDLIVISVQNQCWYGTR